MEEERKSRAQPGIMPLCSVTSAGNPILATESMSDTVQSLCNMASRNGSSSYSHAKAALLQPSGHPCGGGTSRLQEEGRVS